MTDWTISESDVKKHPNFDSMSLDAILFSYGMDVKKGYTVDGREKEEVPENSKDTQFGFTHRSVFTGEIHNCPRYYGEAGTDGRWKRFTENFVAV